MKLLTHKLTFIIAIMLFTGLAASAQNNQSKTSTQPEMKTYVIEREIPNAGNLNAEELKGISQKSCSVLKDLGPKIQWVQSYVTGNKIYCIYKAESEELIREHARKCGFPANKISEVANVISPATAN